LRLAAQVPLMIALHQVGRTHDALDLAEATLREEVRGASVLGYSPTIYALAYRGLLRALRGRPHDGLADLERALGEAEGHEPADPLAIMHAMVVHVAGLLGDEAMAMVHVQRVVALAAHSPSRMVEQVARDVLGQVRVMRAEWSEAVAELERALALQREVPVSGWR